MIIGPNDSGVLSLQVLSLVCPHKLRLDVAILGIDARSASRGVSIWGRWRSAVLWTAFLRSSPPLVGLRALGTCSRLYRSREITCALSFWVAFLPHVRAEGTGV